MRTSVPYFLMLFMFLAVAILPVQASSYTYDISSLEDAEFYLFTNPQECVPCAYLAKALEISGQESTIVAFSNGRKVRLKIKRFDPWDDDVDKSYLARIGYLDEGIPQFSLVKNGKVLGTGRPIPTTAFLNSDQRNQLLPADGEDILKYDKRVTEAYVNRVKKFDMTEAILKSVGRLKSEPAIDELHVNLDGINILVAGTAEGPISNPIFTGMTIKKVLSSLSRVTPIRPVVLYGGGQTSRCDTCELRPNVDPDADIESKEEYLRQRRLVKVSDLKSDQSFTTSNVRTFFEQSKAKNAQRNLIVFVGHGAKNGAVTWMEDRNLNPADLKKFSDHSGSENVLVSGNCYGGIMAQTMACGFMAAPPNRTATGCWEDADTGKSIPDYVSVFFKSLEDKTADANQDGKISFLEAHSYAVPKVDAQDSPYTTMDDFAAKYFDQNEDELPDEVQVKYLQSVLAQFANAAEKKLIADLTQNINPKSFLKVRNVVGREILNGLIEIKYSYDPFGDEGPQVMLNSIENRQALGIPAEPQEGVQYLALLVEGEVVLFKVTQVGHMAEEFAVEIVRSFELPENLKAAFSPATDRLRMLVRRLTFKSLVSNDREIKAQVERVDHCENQSIEEFLRKK